MSSFARAVIVGSSRTPVGSFLGSLSSVTATDLGGFAVKEALNRSGVAPDLVDEVYLGNVLSTGVGQAPARQAAISAGLPYSTVCTTVNKVCASGMKAVMLASQQVQLGHPGVLVAGGFESMSKVPYIASRVREGLRYGHAELVDSIVIDGLTDPYSSQHMGMCGEICAESFGISRAEQDAYAIESYRRAGIAQAENRLTDEVCTVKTLKKRKEVEVTLDEEVQNINLDKVPSLKPAFKKDGTITAANASSLNDGAAAMVIMSETKAASLGLEPVARILGFADAERKPEEFTIAPPDAVVRALKNADISQSSVNAWELNEAFSVVALANMRLLNLDPETVNVNGGAVSIGHPLGCSGARIIGALLTVLKQKSGSIGCAAICNGGGGASAIVIENLQ
eukprot:92830_1